MRKTIILLLALMSFFSFSKNYEKAEDRKEGVSSIYLILKEGKGNSYDFFFEYVIDTGSLLPKLRQAAGTAYKNGNKYVCKDLRGEQITFDIRKDQVVISGSDYLEGVYNYLSESAKEDYETVEWALEEEKGY